MAAMRILRGVLVAVCLAAVLPPALAAPAPKLDPAIVPTLDTAVPALVADKANCAAVGRHAVAIADTLDKIARGRVQPAGSTSGILPADQHPKLLAHATALAAAVEPCLSKLDPKLRAKLAFGIAAAPSAHQPRSSPTPPSKDPYAVPKPQPIPAAAAQQIALFEFYTRAVTDPADPERAGIRFHHANTLRQHDHLEPALVIYREILAKHPTDEVAEYAANLALDSYNRLQKYDELIALAKQLKATPGFLDKRDDLRDTVDKILKMSMRKGAETCESKAKAANDRDLMVKCGEQYLAMYNADPRAQYGDELLYNAGVAFAEGKAVGASIQSLKLLRTVYPNSKLSARATARLGKQYADAAMLPEAAQLLEDYGTKYAGERDAYQAFSDAIYYRRVLGETAKAAALTKTAIRLFGAKQPRFAIEAQFALIGQAEAARDDAALATHATEFLKLYGGKASREQLVMVSTKLGESLWRRSCPLRTALDGLCVEYVRTPAPTTCAPGGATLKVTPRDAARATAARKHFVDAIRQFERSGTRDPFAAHAYALAKLALADAELEAAFAMRAPTDVRDPQKLAAWIADKQKLAAKAVDAYMQVVSNKLGGIAGVSRIALAQHRIGESLYALEVPRALRAKPDQTTAYCSALAAQVEPLMTTAAASYRTCLTAATTANTVDAHATTCERGLAVLDAKSAAPLVEPVLAPTVATVPVQLEGATPLTDKLYEPFKQQKTWAAADCDRIGKALLAAAPKAADKATTYFMAGLAFHRCTKLVDAEQAYRQAGQHAAALSNRAAIAAGAGKAAEARAGWEAALKVSAKLVAARVNLAGVQLGELRKLSPTDPAWRKLDDDIRFTLSSALAVDPDAPAAYIALAQLYLEGTERTPARRSLAKHFYFEAEKRAPTEPFVANALATQQWRDGQTARAVETWTAVAAKSPEATLNLALAALPLRRFDDAKRALATNAAPAFAYEHAIALGVAHRGLGDHAAASTAYQAAIKIAGPRFEAHFALGVLESRAASRAPSTAAQIAAYQRAAAHYRRAIDLATGTWKATAQAELATVDRIISTLQKLPAKP